MVSMVPGKNAANVVIEGNTVSEMLSPGSGNISDRFTQTCMDKVRGLWIISYLKRNRMWKKLFFWLQGPGDRKAG